MLWRFRDRVCLVAVMAEEVIREIETASIDTILDASFVHVFIFRPPLHMWRLIMVLFVYESALSNMIEY